MLAVTLMLMRLIYLCNHDITTIFEFGCTRLMKNPLTVAACKVSIAASIAIATLLGSSAKAQMYQYVLNGGTSTITGSIGSTSFTNATWAMTSVADYATAATNGNLTFLSATAQLQVFSGSSTFTYDLTAPTGAAVRAGFLSTGNVRIFTLGPVFDNLRNLTGGNGLGITTDAVLSLSSLQTPGTYAMLLTGVNSDTNPVAFSTTAGSINISSKTSGSGGSLTVSNYSPSAVPEPAEWAGLAMLGSGLGGLVVRARRRKVTA